MSDIDDDQRPIAKYAHNEDDSEQYRHKVRLQPIFVRRVFAIRRIFIMDCSVREGVHAYALEKKRFFCIE